MAFNKGKASRQRMINLMYLVFIALLALNVSTEVLDGFDLIYDKLQRTIQNTEVRNEQLYSELKVSHDENPVKTGEAFQKASLVKERTDSLFNYIQDLKWRIAVISDGKDADVDNIEARENIDAASEVMLAPITGQGRKLKSAVDSYKMLISGLITDASKRSIIENALSTEPSERAKKNLKNWEQAAFEQMPSIAALTYLSEIQSNVKTAEGEALNSIMKDIDFSDFRVNELNALVIPESNVVMSGMNFKANIVIAAVDTTQRPHIVVNGQDVKDGIFQTVAGRPGSYTINGFMELMGRDGVPWKREFSHTYNVIEQTATVAPLLMDVVYAGIDNPISISIPGIVAKDIVARASQGGTLVSNGSNWVARPTNVGGKFVIDVYARVNNAERKVAQKEFRIRALPDPTAFIEYRDNDGNVKNFKRGTLARTVLVNSGGIKAAIDDGILNIPFSVVNFRTVFVDVMGNASQEVSNGASFSSRQIEQIKRLDRGKTLFIAGIRVKGPDGSERDISPIEIRLN